MLGNKTEFHPLTQETIEGLQAATADPIDAMRLAADFYATNAYTAERARALETGYPLPEPPKLISHYMRALALDIHARFRAMAALFSPEELRRLTTLGPIVEQRLEGDDHVAEMFMKLLAMHPEDAVLWIRSHLDDLEIRFAS